MPNIWYWFTQAVDMIGQLDREARLMGILFIFKYFSQVLIQGLTKGVIIIIIIKFTCDPNSNGTKSSVINKNQLNKQTVKVLKRTHLDKG